MTNQEDFDEDLDRAGFRVTDFFEGFTDSSFFKAWSRLKGLKERGFSRAILFILRLSLWGLQKCQQLVLTVPTSSHRHRWAASRYFTLPSALPSQGISPYRNGCKGGPRWSAIRTPWTLRFLGHVHPPFCDVAGVAATAGAVNSTATIPDQKISEVKPVLAAHSLIPLRRRFRQTYEGGNISIN